MHISVSEAEGQLLELIRRAKAGEEVVLTLEGRPVGAVTSLEPSQTSEKRRAIIRDIVGQRKRATLNRPDAAHSQDFLYNDDGLPA